MNGMERAWKQHIAQQYALPPLPLVFHNHAGDVIDLEGRSSATEANSTEFRAAEARLNDLHFARGDYKEMFVHPILHIHFVEAKRGEPQ